MVGARIERFGEDRVTRARDSSVNHIVAPNSLARLVDAFGWTDVILSKCSTDIESLSPPLAERVNFRRSTPQPHFESDQLPSRPSTVSLCDVLRPWARSQLSALQFVGQFGARLSTGSQQLLARQFLC